jgi:hypothetical protein
VKTRLGGLRVAYISAEEDERRFALLVAGAMDKQGLTAIERANVAKNLVFHDGTASGFS